MSLLTLLRKLHVCILICVVLWFGRDYMKKRKRLLTVEYHDFVLQILIGYGYLKASYGAICIIILREALIYEKSGHCPLVVGGVNPCSLIKPKFTRFSNHSERDFWHHNMNANASKLAWYGFLISSLPSNTSLHRVLNHCLNTPSCESHLRTFVRN